MSELRSPPSYRAVERYQDFRVALEVLELRMENRHKQSVYDNPFDRDEYPRRHNIYNAILEYGATRLYNHYCLDDTTVNQFVIDDTTLPQFDTDFDIGSDAHLDCLLRMKNAGKDIARVNFDAYHYNRECLDFIAPKIAAWALQDEEGEEWETQLRAIRLDQNMRKHIPHLAPKDSLPRMKITVGENDKDKFEKKFQHSLKLQMR